MGGRGGGASQSRKSRAIPATLAERLPKRSRSSIMDFMQPKYSCRAGDGADGSDCSHTSSPAGGLAHTPALSLSQALVPDTSTPHGQPLPDSTLHSLQRHFASQQALDSPLCLDGIRSVDDPPSLVDGAADDDSFTLHSQPAYERMLSQPALPDSPGSLGWTPPPGSQGAKEPDFAFPQRGACQAEHSPGPSSGGGSLPWVAARGLRGEPARPGGASRLGTQDDDRGPVPCTSGRRPRAQQPLQPPPGGSPPACSSASDTELGRPRAAGPRSAPSRRSTSDCAGATPGQGSGCEGGGEAATLPACFLERGGGSGAEERGVSSLAGGCDRQSVVLAAPSASEGAGGPADSCCTQPGTCVSGLGPLGADGCSAGPEGEEDAAGRTPVLDLAAPIGCVTSSTRKLFPIFKPKRDYKHLYIVRHGESEYNAATGSGAGWADPLVFDAPLTAVGRSQARALGRRLRALGLPADVQWVCSPLTRAIETMLLAMQAFHEGEQRGENEAGAGNEAGDGREVELKPSSAAPVLPLALPRQQAASAVHVCCEISEKLVTTGDVGRTRSELARRFPLLRATLDALPEEWWYSEPGRRNCAVAQELSCREPQRRVLKRIARFKTWLQSRDERVIVAFGHSGFWKHFCTGYCGVKPERMHNCELRHLQNEGIPIASRERAVPQGGERESKMSGLRNFLHATYKSAAEKVLPPLANSAFEEKGVLTPDEFVRAGEYLVHTCPTWSWEAGERSKAWPFLPPNKQYLITRNAVEVYGDQEETEVEMDVEGEGWVTADNAAAESGHPDRELEHVADLSDMDDNATESKLAKQVGELSVSRAPSVPEVAGDDLDEVPDIDDLEDVEAEADEAAVPLASAPAPDASQASTSAPAASSGEALVRTRTYDLLITYDKYYQVPRFWLIGYDEDRNLLSPSQVLEDVSEEHARKTVTLEPHPHESSAVQAASIHPCRHAHVMRRLSRVVAREGSFVVEHYLVLFLKFIASVVPTIEYDYTMAVGE